SRKRRVSHHCRNALVPRPRRRASPSRSSREKSGWARNSRSWYSQYRPCAPAQRAATAAGTARLCDRSGKSLNVILILSGNSACSRPITCWASRQNGHWEALHWKMVTGAPAGPRVIVGSAVKRGGLSAAAAEAHPSRSRPAATRRMAERSRVTCRGRSGRAIGLDGGDDVRAALGVTLQREDLLLGRLLQQLREGGVPVVRLVERGVLPDHGLLDH